MEIRWIHPRQPEKEIEFLLAVGYQMVYPSSGEVEVSEIEEYYSTLGNSLAIDFPCVILKNGENILVIEL